MSGGGVGGHGEPPGDRCAVGADGERGGHEGTAAHGAPESCGGMDGLVSVPVEIQADGLGVLAYLGHAELGRVEGPS
jgi:hypothetical protein